MLDTPRVSADVDNEGFAVFNWEPVAEAQIYYVIKYSRDLYGVDFKVIGATDDTSWVSVEDDDYYMRDMEFDPDWITTQNNSFQCFEFSEDELHSDFLSEEQIRGEKDSYAFGVIAVGNGKISRFSMIDTPALLARLPYGIASRATEELEGGNIAAAENFDNIAVNVAITMADGSTGVRVFIPDPSTLEDDEMYRGTVDSGVSRVKTKGISGYIDGTAFTWSAAVINFDDTTAAAEAERILARNLAARDKTGFSYAYEYKKPIGLDPQKIEAAVKTTPAIKYPVNGSSEMVRHIAANIIAGETLIDLNAFLSAADAPDIEDAVKEALMQNPFVLSSYGRGFGTDLSFHVYYREGIVEIMYPGSIDISGYDLTERQSRQETLLAAATQFKEQYIKSGMSDEDKAREICRYLTASGEYAHDVFAFWDSNAPEYAAAWDAENKYAWNADGILIRHLGVCVSYAKAFKALADVSGLDAVCIVGAVDGSSVGHEWNKVRIDEKWLIVDPTWIDDGAEPNWRWFGLKDSEAGRTQNEDFMVDYYLSNYATE